MRKFLIILCSVFLIGSALAQTVQPGHSGAWYNPEQSGHGLSVEVISSKRAIMYWYAFDPQGHPVWLLIDGLIEGNSVRGEAYYVDGMYWGKFDPASKSVTPWGTVNLEFIGCNAAEVSWSSLFPEYGQGQLPLVRLTSIHGSKCHSGAEKIEGYYDVFWTETFSGEVHIGTAIIDQTGFITVDFEDPEWDFMHMHGDVSAIESELGEYRGEVTMDVRIFKSPVDPARDLALSGTYSFGFWPTMRVESGTDIFDLVMSGERLGSAPVSSEKIAGDWLLKFGGRTYEVEISADGTFEWAVIGLHGVVWDYEVELQVPADGSPLIAARLVLNSGEPIRGNASYYIDHETDQDHLEIRAGQDGLMFLLMLDRIER